MVKQNRQKTTRTSRITSVSLSREFAELLDVYQLSPTDVFRKGLAVTLAELGHPKYNTPMNKARIEIIKDKVKLDNLINISDQLLELVNILTELRKELK